MRVFSLCLLIPVVLSPLKHAWAAPEPLSLEQARKGLLKELPPGVHRSQGTSWLGGGKFRSAIRTEVDVQPGAAGASMSIVSDFMRMKADLDADARVLRSETEFFHPVMRERTGQEAFRTQRLTTGEIEVVSLRKGKESQREVLESDEGCLDSDVVGLQLQLLFLRGFRKSFSLPLLAKAQRRKVDMSFDFTDTQNLPQFAKPLSLPSELLAGWQSGKEVGVFTMSVQGLLGLVVRAKHHFSIQMEEGVPLFRYWGGDTGEEEFLSLKPMPTQQTP